MKTLTQNVQGIQVPNSGHWIPEEQPEVIIKLLYGFFEGNTTNTSTPDPMRY
jgi:pimeloyl-ACP methyl ester carboxylesterase